MEDAAATESQHSWGRIGTGSTNVSIRNEHISQSCGEM